MQKIDTATVKCLELRAPKSSTIDFLALQGQVLTGQIFSAFNRVHREAIWTEISKVTGLIPSLYTMFEDINYLYECAHCMKQLINITPGETVFSAFKESFKHGNQMAQECILQESESVLVVQPSRGADRFEIGYRQLWLYAMRHFRQMAKEPKRNKLKAKPRVERANEAVLVEFGALAFKLGFDSDQIHLLRKRSPDREIARQTLFRARDPRHYEYNDATFESHVSQIMDLFSTAVPRVAKDVKPALVTDYPEASGERCGFADEEADERDRKYLFIKRMHTKDETEGPSITSFYVRRSIYFAFFGQPLGDLLSIGVSDRHAAGQSASDQSFISSLWESPGSGTETSYLSAEEDLNHDIGNCGSLLVHGFPGEGRGRQDQISLGTGTEARSATHSSMSTQDCISRASIERSTSTAEVDRHGSQQRPSQRAVRQLLQRHRYGRRRRTRNGTARRPGTRAFDPQHRPDENESSDLKGSKTQKKIESDDQIIATQLYETCRVYNESI